MESTTDSNHALRARVEELRRRLDFLRSNLSPLAESATALRPFPIPSGSRDTPAYARDPPGESQVTDELARQYRVTGRSCFPVELARGARAKEEMEEIERERRRRKGKSKEKEVEEVGDGFVRKGMAVRLETFHNGRFFEPYYVVFAHALPDLDDPLASSLPLYITDHTLPHWLPLREIAWRYLGVRLRDDDGTAGYAPEDDKGGEADLELFLSHLTAQINAFVSRREQLVALQSAYSPDTYQSLHFRVFSSEPCDRVVVEWRLSAPNHKVKEVDDDSEDEEDLEEDGEGTKPSRTVVVQVALHDLRTDRFETVEADEVASLLVRYVETRPSPAAPHQKILSGLAKRALQRQDQGITIEGVVRDIVEATMGPGWSPENT
ncbi:hypothetical protein JCM11641_003728 [Rhodosporidiobolus odoratus]